MPQFIRELFVLGLMTCTATLCAMKTSVESVTVRTRAANNPAPKVWFRVPDGYKATKGRTWRTLVIFGGRNCAGSNEVSNVIGWAKWADRHGVFLVAPGFRDDQYWEPQAWSGRALLNALAEIRKSYDIDTSKLLYYGYSAGSQASNLFAAWRPDLCRAWVSHACGVFHEPNTRMKGVPGLVTCGDADAARDILSRDFVAKARKVGQPVIWKSFPNHPHDVPPGSLALARAFLGHWHETKCGELGEAVAQERDPPGKDRDKRGPPRFVGDEPEGVYWPVGSPEAASVPVDDRVELPDRAVAAAWGREGSEAARAPLPRRDATVGEAALLPLHARAQPAKVLPFAVEGIDFLCRVPRAYAPDSRVVVLFGGRNWPAGKTLDAFGFGETADGCGLFLLAPSFAGDDYWQPKSGTGRVVCRAVDVVRRRHGLKPLPVILYGYSAGGQCAALFADWMRGEVGAWGAHACGVFPNGAPPRVPALITCGEDDVDRLSISRTFACGAREAGCPVLLRTFHGVGHGLEVDALDLARLWIRDVSRPDCRVVSWGEDDTWRVRPPREIDAEYRNPLYSSELAEAWRR